jgi:EAL domain-containing protein (putative c-di-GMP-specific phosphodiesterase class I)
MGESLNMGVVAEGVETSEQADWLMSERCSEAQGFHFTRPLQVRDIDAFINGFSGAATRKRSGKGSRRKRAAERTDRVA